MLSSKEPRCSRFPNLPPPHPRLLLVPYTAPIVVPTTSSSSSTTKNQCRYNSPVCISILGLGRLCALKILEARTAPVGHGLAAPPPPDPSI